jgi:hypothetical protein
MCGHVGPFVMPVSIRKKWRVGTVADAYVQLWAESLNGMSFSRSVALRMTDLPSLSLHVDLWLRLIRKGVRYHLIDD